MSRRRCSKEIRGCKVRAQYLKNLSKVLVDVDSVVVGGGVVLFDTGGVVFVMRCSDFSFDGGKCYVMNLGLPVKVVSALGDSLLDCFVEVGVSGNEMIFDVCGTQVRVPVFSEVSEDVVRVVMDDLDVVLRSSVYLDSVEVESLKRIGDLRLVGVGSNPLKDVVFFSDNCVYETSGVMHLMYVFSDRSLVEGVVGVTRKDLFNMLQFFGGGGIRVGFSDVGVVIDGGDAKAVVRKLDIYMDLDELVENFKRGLRFIGELSDAALGYFRSLVGVVRESDSAEVEVGGGMMVVNLASFSGLVRGEFRIDGGGDVKFLTKAGVLAKLLQAGNVLYAAEDGRGVVCVGEGGRLKVFVLALDSVYGRWLSNQEVE